MSKTTRGNRSGIGILGILGVLFVALKLIGVIDWSWGWVTLPFWGGLAAVVLLLVGALTLDVFDSWRKNRGRF